MKYSNTAITQLTRWYKQVLIKCAILNAAILVGVAPVMAADYDSSATVATNLTNFHNAISGSGTYSTDLGAGTITIDSTFATDNPKTTRDALAQLLGGSSDSATYAVTTTAVGDYVNLTGGTISKTTLGVDLSQGLVASDPYNGTNYISAATSMANADVLLDTKMKSIADVVGDSSSGLVKGVSDNASAISTLQTTVAGKQDALTAGSGISITGNTISVSGVTSAMIEDGTIQTIDINDSAITTNKINNGAVTTDKINNGAVTTGKIEDGAVTKGKLETTVQTSLGKADTALQKADITTGTANGTINVDGTNVAVYGLGTAAYANTGDFQAAITSTNMLDADLVDDTTSTHKFVTAAEKTQIATNASNITTLQGDVVMDAAAQSSADYAAGAKVDAAVAAIDVALKADETKLATAEGNITTLQGDVVMDAAAQSSADYAAGAKVDAAVAAIDVALKADETRLTTAEGSIADLTTNTSTGVINVKEANIGATGLSSAGDIKTTGSGNIVSAGDISTTNGTISGKTGNFTGNLGVTGTTTTGALSVTNNATVGGNATVTGTLNAGATTVASLTTTGDISGAAISGTTGTFTGKVTSVGLDAGSGNIKTTAKVDAGSLEVTGASVMKGGLTIEDGSTPKVTLGTDGTIVATGKITSVGLDAGNGAITTTGTLSAGATTVSSLTSGAISGTTGSFSGALTSDTLTVNNAATLKSTLDVTGNTKVGGTLDVTGALSGSSATFSGALSSASLAVTNGATVGTLKVGSSGVMTGVDAGSSAITTGSATVFASTATVLKSAENATFTAAASAKNVSTGTLNSAISSLDTAIGDMTGFNTNNYAKTTTNVAGNLVQLDGVLKNTNDIIGSAMNANGTKNTDALNTVKNQSGTAVTNLTDAAKLIGDLSSTGISQGTLAGQIGNVGDTVASRTSAIAKTNTVADNLLALDTAIGANMTVAGRTTAAYKTDATKSVNENLSVIDAYLGGDVTESSRTTGKMLATNTVKANFEALDAAIGTDADLALNSIADGTNGVAKANSVNKNLNALNNIIGDVANDLHTTYTATGHTGNALTNGGDNVPATVVAALNNIDATLGTIHGLKANNSNLKAKSNLADGTTVEQHLVALDDSIGDRTFDTTHYVAPHSDLATATRVLDTNLYRLDDEVKDLRKSVNRGLASMAAMSAMVPNARANGNTQLSVGTGMYSGHAGFALGGFHWFNDNVLMNVGMAYGDGDSSEMIYRAGITYSW